MTYKTENIYIIHLKDGTKFESRGNSERYQSKSTIHNEFEWTAFHIHKELRLQGKTMEDVSSVTYRLRFNDPIL